MKSTDSQSSKRAVKNTRRMFPGIYGANQKIRKVFQVSKNGSFSRYVPQERHIILPRPMSSIPFVFLVDLYSVTADILVAMPVEGTRRVFKFVRPHNRLRFFEAKLACCYATDEQWSRFNSSGPGAYKSSVRVIFILFNWPSSGGGWKLREKRSGRFVGRRSPLSRCIDPAGFIQSPNRSETERRNGQAKIRFWSCLVSLSLLPPTAAHGRGFFVCRTTSRLYRIQRPTCSRFSLL